MENKEVAKSEFIPLARKSRASRIILPILASIGLILTVLLIGGGKSLEMILLTLFVAIVGFIAPLCCFIWAVRRPEVVVESDGSVLRFFYKTGWVEVSLNDVKKVRYTIAMFMRVPLKSGRLIIVTKEKTYMLFSINDVVEVASEINKMLNVQNENTFN